MLSTWVSDGDPESRSSTGFDWPGLSMNLKSVSEFAGRPHRTNKRTDKIPIFKLMLGIVVRYQSRVAQHQTFELIYGGGWFCDRFLSITDIHLDYPFCLLYAGNV